MPSDSAPIMVPKGIREGNREARREEGREGGKQLERISDREGEIKIWRISDRQRTYRAITAEVKGNSRRYQRRERG